MKRTTITIVMAALCLIFKAEAQENKAIDIGAKDARDKLSPYFWKASHLAIGADGHETAIKIDDYKGKLIIIDFWATWCSSCISGFAKMEALQKEFPEQLKIVLVTAEQGAKVKSFLRARQNRGAKLSLTTIIADTLLNKTFEHQFIPHYVWIDKEGKVINTTSSDAVSSEMIRSILNGKKMNIQQKQDIEISKPLFSLAALPESNLEYYSILLKGSYPGLPTGISYRSTNETVFGIAITNSSMKYIFQSAARGILPDNISKRIMLDSTVKNSLSEYYEDELWMKENLYTYELRIPKPQANLLYPKMLEHLNQITPYQGTILNRAIQCMVLIKTSKAAIKSKGGKRYNDLEENGMLCIRNAPILALTGRLNNAFDRLVVDETGIKFNVDMDMKIYSNDLKRTNSELAKHGLRLEISDRETKVLLIEEKSKNKQKKNLTKNL